MSSHSKQSTPKTRALSNVQVTALKRVLEFNWPDELMDYMDQRDGNEITKNDPRHVFTHMARLDQFVCGHKKTAEDFRKEAARAHEASLNQAVEERP